MMLSQLLSVALLALLSSVVAVPSSKNDLFRAIATHVPRAPDPPICCLKPLPPVESADDEVLLSFEEWKEKQSALHDQAKDLLNRSGNAQNTGSKGLGDAGSGSEAVVLSSGMPVIREGSNSEETTKFQPNEAVSPHFRVPLTDRFNYANLDCSARVHTSHRSAKSSSSILSSKRDRYMLSPCNSSKKEQHFVVVELCEDIRIDTVQLANFEFFSGVFKDFTVSVAKTYTTEPEGWTIAGTYKAKNIRGVQSFHPPTSLRDFYRYIRIDFQSHYGSEYYCPVSLLRVYGLTHLEQWKWDTWEAESKAKRDGIVEAGTQEPLSPDNGATGAPAPAESFPVQVSGDRRLQPTNSSTNHRLPVHDHPAPPTNISGSQGIAQISTKTPSSSSVPTASSERKTTTTTKNERLPSVTAINETQENSTTVHETLTRSTGTNLTSSADSNTTSSMAQSNDAPQTSDFWTATPLPPDSSISNTSNSSTPHPSPVVPSIRSSSIAASITMSSAPSIVISPPANHPPVAPAATGGESIYRTIMNRLAALETNHTLYARYVEQQTGGVREVLKRLGEDVGRLEGIGRAQTLMYQRTLHDWEKQQRRLQMDYGALMSRVEYLSDEIVLEKRLGIAQLCLLLAVLVFMGLTRGSRGESFMEHAPVKFNKSMREWGKRHLSFSNDWTNRFKSKSRSRSPDRSPSKLRPPPGRVLLPRNFNGDIKIGSPTKDFCKKEHSGSVGVDAMPGSSNTNLRSRRGSRSRTPSSRTSGSRHHQRPVTPIGSTSRPWLQRSNSQGGVQNGGWSGGVGAVPKSAKRWARSAHLHEVRGGGDIFGKQPYGEDDGNDGSGGREIVDVFTASAAASRYDSRADGLTLDTDLNERGQGGRVYDTFILKYEEGDPWVDTDYSVEESEVDCDAMLDSRRLPAFSGNEH